ncbi:hypothetical protein D3C79_952820 [compost metagenome]
MNLPLYRSVKKPVRWVPLKGATGRNMVLPLLMVVNPTLRVLPWLAKARPTPARAARIRER